MNVQSFLLYWQLIGSFNEITDHKHRSLRNMFILEVHFKQLAAKKICVSFQKALKALNS